MQNSWRLREESSIILRKTKDPTRERIWLVLALNQVISFFLCNWIHNSKKIEPIILKKNMLGLEQMKYNMHGIYVPISFLDVWQLVCALAIFIRQWLLRCEPSVRVMCKIWEKILGVDHWKSYWVFKKNFWIEISSQANCDMQEPLGSRGSLTWKFEHLTPCSVFLI